VTQQPAEPVVLVRIESGTADPAELAALTAVLLARSYRCQDGDPDPAGAGRPHRRLAHWRRLERAGGFQTPQSWRTVR
jgi:hypothetical protein